MGQSSNTFWHQTKKDGLKGIIRDQCLYYSYCIEHIFSNVANLESDFAFPMISVCDLPLSETGNYLKKYGDYTIGFSSAWGKRQGFSTVWYCDGDSETLRSILYMLVPKYVKYGLDTSRDDDYQRIIYLLSHVKQYEGPLPKRNYKRYRFYDEREQRLVPSPERLFLVGEEQYITDYEAYKRRHKGSSLLSKNLYVPFEWEDIKYIIVERTEEKDEVRGWVERRSGRKDLHISYFTNKEVREDIFGLSHDVREEPVIIAGGKDMKEMAKNLNIPIFQ